MPCEPIFALAVDLINFFQCTGNDYGPAMPGYVRFTPSVNRSCVVIPIVDDFIFEEEVEEVYALLQLSDSTQRVELNPNITTIQIKGEDGEKS